MKKMTERALSITVIRLFLSISDRPITLDLALRLFVHLVAGSEICDFGKYWAGNFSFSMKRCLWDADTPMRKIPGLDASNIRSALRMIVAMNGFSEAASAGDGNPQLCSFPRLVDPSSWRHR
jgi:hypothetical protein